MTTKPRVTTPIQKGQTCSGSCGKYLPWSEFYKHPETKTRHFKQCKSCVKAARRNRYKSNQTKTVSGEQHGHS